MQTEALQDFHLKILPLAPGTYTHRFLVGDTFFAAFDHSIVKKGALEATVQLEKTETLLRVFFNINGFIELESDRSLALYNHSISLRQQLVYKFGEENAELSEELFQIRWDTPTLDLSQPIYEFITLAVPMRKLTPAEEQEPDGPAADADRRLVYRSAEPEEQAEPDPTWDALRKLFPN